VEGPPASPARLVLRQTPEKWAAYQHHLQMKLPSLLEFNDSMVRPDMVLVLKNKQQLTPSSTPSILALAKILSLQFLSSNCIFSEIQLGTRLHCSQSRLVIDLMALTDGFQD
jgi:hypothetical protein